ncbi:MAG: hypothetical protein M5R36_24365 [Deltaproteobacteria bacterium]|nr:hypothetical protein [Deltaproteobacteria bacterium]
MDSFVEEMRKKYPVEIKDDLLTDEEGAEDAPDVPGLMKMPGAVSGGDDDAAAGPGIKVKVEPSEEKESE